MNMKTDAYLAWSSEENHVVRKKMGMKCQSGQNMTGNERILSNQVKFDDWKIRSSHNSRDVLGSQ